MAPGRVRFDDTWGDLYVRCCRLAHALALHGVRRGDTVAAMLPNTPAMVEAHFGVPMAGAVLNALNTRLDAASIGFQLNHGEAKVLITDREFAPTIKAALADIERELLIIDVDDPIYDWGGRTHRNARLRSVYFAKARRLRVDGSR